MTLLGHVREVDRDLSRLGGQRCLVLYWSWPSGLASRLNASPEVPPAEAVVEFDAELDVLGVVACVLVDAELAVCSTRSVFSPSST